MQYCLSQRVMLTRKVLFLTILFLISERSIGQVSISGPTCVVAGSSYNYSVSGNYDPTATIEWCLSSNGSVLQVYGSNPTSNGNCKSAVGGNYMAMTWNTSGSGTVYVTTSAGTANLNVTIVNALDAGTVSNPTHNIPYNTIPSTINCPVAQFGACNPGFTYRWQSSTDGVTWSNMVQTSQNLTVTSPLLITTYFRRMVTEVHTNTIGYSSATDTHKRCRKFHR